MFTGLSAFPLTPLNSSGIDESAFETLVSRLVSARVDSICALGSTGSYAYLDRAERARTVELAVATAGGLPVFAGVGALRTRDVLHHVEDAQNLGVSAVLLAPMSYQPLTDGEVFGLFEEVTANLSVPLVVYDNPTTTRVVFSDELHAQIASLPGVASVKIPPVSADPQEAHSRVATLRSKLPAHISLGISGDMVAAEGLIAGCDAWYSAIAGVLPEPCVAITRAAQSGEADLARELSSRMKPLFDLIARFGSYRVASAVAEELQLVSTGNLPAPIRPLSTTARANVLIALQQLQQLK
ncbi:dihydrodipicolinate synthase family protein [Arthrobacter sp. MYb227]|uniref:dihydrodipicolinate synthase family protein n=1 Tax=Arthrobacter sp. MYb227 TaxID=1848601 RepID=UPI000CFCEBD6|nr:dihydrodipicolinate synthase family protein [Arthrobacter sp. MYb227]PQZ88126.1 dihydrodipicolinate synthase family protein [Arthrobacter sp. MYb227]